MTRPPSDSVIISLVDALQRRGSWCGETHIQKNAYFLSRLEPECFSYAFILYKHGPFSFELHDELTAMRARTFVTLEATFPYGSRIFVTDRGRTWKSENAAAVHRLEPTIEFIAKKLAGCGVATLERLATALFFTQENASTQRVGRILEAKPHISSEQASAAVAEVDRILAEWREAHPRRKKAA